MDRPAHQEEVAQWDFQNKGRSRWTGTSCIVLEVPPRNLLSMCDFLPCDRIVQRAYCMAICEKMRMIFIEGRERIGNESVHMGVPWVCG